MKFLFLPLAITVLAAACDREPRVLERDGEPDVLYVSSEDSGMEAAIQRALASLPRFKDALASPPAGSTDYAVKVAFPCGADRLEHLWLGEPGFSNGEVFGVVQNEPVHATELQLGQRVSRPEKDVSDWMYVRDGFIEGGFTIRAALNALPPARREEHMQVLGARFRQDGSD